MNTKPITIAILFMATTIVGCSTQNNPIAPQASQAPQTAQQAATRPTEPESPVAQNLMQRLNLTQEQHQNLRELAHAFASDYQAAQGKPSDQQDLMGEFENDFLNMLSGDQQIQYQTQRDQLLLILESLIGQKA